MITDTRGSMPLSIRWNMPDDESTPADGVLWDAVLAKASEYIEYSASSASAGLEGEVQNTLRLNALLQNYICHDVGEVYSYLTRHVGLFPLLEEAPVAIRRVYGPCSLKLEVLTEPEEGWSRLFLVIQSILDTERLLELSERFSQEWIAPRLATFEAESFSVTEEPVGFDWHSVATLAAELAARDDEASSRAAISRAYYALYCTARDRAGLNVAGSRDSHKAVFDYYASRDNAKLKMFGANDLPGLFRDRKDADYREDLQITKIRASLAVKKAQRLLAAIDSTSDEDIRRAKRR